MNENAGNEFTHYIAESKRKELQRTLANARFVSLLPIQVALMKFSLLCGAIVVGGGMRKCIHGWST